MALTKYVNLVFQGGGVRGIAYAGVLENMPPHIKAVRVGGTSAGALVAALIAIGKRDELRTYLSHPKLFQLVSGEDQSRMQRLKESWCRVKPELNVLTSDPGRWRRWRAYRKIYSQLRSTKPGRRNIKGVSCSLDREVAMLNGGLED